MSATSWTITDVARHGNTVHCNACDKVTIDDLGSSLKITRPGMGEETLLHVRLSEDGRSFDRGQGVRNNPKWNRYRGTTQYGPGPNENQLIGIIGYRDDYEGDDDDRDDYKGDDDDTEVFIATKPPANNGDTTAGGD